ncbi:hypothetical protein CONPUDRAFT_147329 [Coniophora puteana RWD-64-598 SS2]|uniref:F-box domain-containing protein n=1 Tax=Coniophora puteana (strain RWD-64-598) TaxID=741705 RepID=A0A5M3M965_CONPW|nr:uncharacterized protein CONPUDRAFT_147329 [Coniophora puteana RWD-64-598 SS2]EIW75191.1 hypothetical protein CONPUDRAFT_147329 [Coniophora puteana RWD-64-598 SS2]
MHKFLLVPELLRNILSNLDPDDPHLSIRDLWAIRSEHFTLERAMQSSDWAILKKYTHRIRYFIKQLYVAELDSPVYPFFPLFVGPQLISSCRDDATVDLRRHSNTLLSQLPEMETLDLFFVADPADIRISKKRLSPITCLFMGPTPSPSKTLQKTPQSPLAGLEINTSAVPYLDNALLEEVSQALPRLRSLTICGAPGWHSNNSVTLAGLASVLRNCTDLTALCLGVDPSRTSRASAAAAATPWSRHWGSQARLSTTLLRCSPRGPDAASVRDPFWIMGVHQ